MGPWPAVNPLQNFRHPHWFAVEMAAYGSTTMAKNRLFLDGKVSAPFSAEELMIQSFRDLQVWQKSMTLAERVYMATEKFPRSEEYGLRSQVRRAAVSVPSNIAEGKAIGGQAYRRHVKFALGSNAELQTQLELAMRLTMLNEAVAGELKMEASEVGRMLAGLLRALPKT
jgi:four helix bundle protein